MVNSRFSFRVWNKRKKRYDERYVIGSNGWAYELVDVGNEWYDLIPNEEVAIEQCTGLTDKNGKLIYEGDIVVGSWSTKLIVFWDVISSSFRVNPFEDKCGDREIHYYTVIATPRDGSIKCINYEVVGNIHEMEVTK